MVVVLVWFWCPVLCFILTTLVSLQWSAFKEPNLKLKAALNVLAFSSQNQQFKKYFFKKFPVEDEIMQKKTKSD